MFGACKLLCCVEQNHLQLIGLALWMHGPSRRQISLVNIVVGLIGSDGILRSICLMGSTIAEDSTANNQSRAIIFIHRVYPTTRRFNFTANYPNGHGDAFHDWMRRYHPGELMMPVSHTLGGYQKDTSFVGALLVYMGHRFFVQFLHEELCSSSKENILQMNMFIILRATDMIAQLHIASIIFIAVVIPVRWLAGKTRAWPS